MMNRTVFRLFELRKDACYRYVSILGLRFKWLRGSTRKHLHRIAGAMSGMTPEQMDKLVRFSQALSLKQINRDEIASKVENLHTRGVSDYTGTPRLVVSLTSYPGRMYDLHLGLYSLLTQTHKPDKIVLWLAEEQFPCRELDVPLKVRDLCRHGLEIRWCPDYRSYKKLIPALKEFPEAAIVTADDDLYYPADWLKRLWDAYQAGGGVGIYAHRCHCIRLFRNRPCSYRQWVHCIQKNEGSFRVFPTSGGGVLYSPACLHEDVTNVQKAMALCPTADDIWFWGMGVLQGTKVTIIPDPISSITYTNPQREARLNADGTLYASNVNGGNDSQLSALLAAYPLIGQKLHNSE